MEHDQTHVGHWPDPPVPDLDAEGRLHPPWLKYPNLPRRSMGWRMGIGESYLDNFRVWWLRQPRNVRLAVRAKYPEPQDWSGFWSSLSRA